MAPRVAALCCNPCKHTQQDAAVIKHTRCATSSVAINMTTAHTPRMHSSVSWLELLCDPVVQSLQALEEHDALSNTPFQIYIEQVCVPIPTLVVSVTARICCCAPCCGAAAAGRPATAAVNRYLLPARRSAANPPPHAAAAIE